MLSKTWKKKLKLYDEIDKSLGITKDETLKTKKLDNEIEDADEE